jgi:glycosyltransferase involved in cell wall biosynthesis
LDDRPLAIGIDGRELQGRPTGVGRYLRSLLRHLREGHDTLFVYFDGKAPPDPVLDHPRVRGRELGGGGTRGLVWQERLLPRAARRDPLDVFFSPAYSCPLSFSLPRVTTVHDASFFFHPQDFTFADALRRRTLARLSVRASAVVIAVSEFTRRELASLFPAHAARVRVIEHGPDEDLPAPPPRREARAGLGLPGPFLLTVGSVLNRRCLPELFRAVARLARRYPGLVLDVVGDNRTHPRLDLERLRRERGLGPHVRLSGFVPDPDLVRRYAAADVAVFLSEYEGFGLPALEAAARGVPLVTSRAPALGEVFASVALTVDPRDDVAVARAVATLLDDAGERERRIAAGRALAARHSWAEAAARTRQALAEAARA